MKPLNSSRLVQSRRGSTLIIVIALLGLLSFVGMVFFSFASSERSAAEYFSDEKKGRVDEPDNVWDHFLEQLISGPGNRPSHRLSVLRSPDRGNSMVSNMIGTDLSPFSGEGIEMEYNSGTGLPQVIGPFGNDWLDYVDSPVARNGNENRSFPRPSMDVDYTYPDINNMFLAYRGWAIRDNGTGNTPRFERVPIIIPSFMRPQYMKTSTVNGFAGNNTPTDIDWASAFNGTSRASAKFRGRSFRPHPQHITGFLPDGQPVFRFLTDVDAAGVGVASGGFPFVPDDNLVGQAGGNNGIRGEMGILTGSEPDAYELDVDNDRDGIREGIWLDTNFPVQEFVDGSGTRRLYTVLHSVTVYDLDGLIDLNVTGNVAGINRGGNLKTLAGAGVFDTQFISRSNLGLGPNEINPLWALRGNSTEIQNGGNTSLDTVREQIFHHFGINVVSSPTFNSVTQANMEWLWLLAGRAEVSGTTLNDLYPGRWGEADRLFNAVKPGGTFLMADLPRPGQPGLASATLSSGVRYGGNATTNGRDGFDDNQDRYDGEIDTGLGRIRPFGTPMDYAGTGRMSSAAVTGFTPATGLFTVTGDVRIPLLHSDTTTVGPEQFQGFSGYTVVRDVAASPPRYIFGQNGVYDNGSGDDLVDNVAYDANFEDMMETIFDPDLADRRFDNVLGPQDVFALHMTGSDLSTAPEKASDRLTKLAPYALGTGNDPFKPFEQVTPGVRGRFTTTSNSLHRFLMRSPFGADGRPGDRGIDDDNDGTTDEPDEVLATGYRDQDRRSRWWEFTADADGADADGDGFPDGDGNYEFPPMFFEDSNGNDRFDSGETRVVPYSSLDPFRPQVRRLITIESGESRGLFGQMPLSPNHLLDVERNNRTPAEGTVEFLRYMQRAGMRFRPLTDHPLASETAGINTIPTYDINTPVNFPPQTVTEREFWARRDRQKLCRDIYVLLYTTGGAQVLSTDSTLIRNYAAFNSSEPRLYTDDQLRRMAQFAVNMVDAMDSDNIITKFEYDKNLGNGWNLDDDPYNNESGPPTDTTGLYPEENGTRGVVFGIEAQELTFSEVLAARSPLFASTYSDSPQTIHNETSEELNFLHVELQNMRPTPVDLAAGTTGTTNENFAIWQLARIDRVAATDPEPAVPTQTMTLMTGNGTVTGGQRFTIAMAAVDGDPGNTNPTQWGTADLYVDSDSDNDFELISPDIGTASVSAGDVVTPQADLDLIHTTHFANWLSSGNGKQPGQFCDALQAYGGNTAFELTASGAQEGFDMVLRRRANPAMPELTLADNPWIEVDRVRVVFNDIFLEEMNAVSGMMEMALRLNNAPSIERTEALDASFMSDYLQIQDTDSQTWRYNTIGSERNSLADTDFGYQQMHFDREFASSVELLNVPIVSPQFLTHRFARMRYSPYRQTQNDYNTANPVGVPDPRLMATAEAMFLQPNFPDTGFGDESSRDNRWYRLFQFVEVPSRVHRMLGNYLTLQKIPGKININTMRHREVLAGLIDNPAIADVPPLLDVNGNQFEDGPFMTSVASLGRDTWQEFIQDRDGPSVTSFDQAAGAVRQFLIPGTPNAKPFRSLGFGGSEATTDNGLDRTLLRRLDQNLDDDGDGIDDESVANGDDPSNNRHWLEVATNVTHANPRLAGDGSATQADMNNQVSRHQILSKVMNNTTTVSNTFIVFGTAAYFEVHEDPTTGFVQIGGRFDLDGDGDETNDEQRSVFVIDRTDAFQAYDPGTGDFNWKQLVKASLKVK